MARSFRGAVVAVTGASSGVGRAIARAFGAEGAVVGLLARNREALEHAAREIEAAGGAGVPLPTDVADPAAVDAAADELVRRHGRLDLWINCAMVSVLSPVMEMTAEEFRRVTEVTYLGYVHGTRAALRHMLPRDAGHVIQIGSALAYRSIPLQSAYCAAKAAIRGFTDALRCELLHDGSRVALSTLHLPAVNTPQFEVVRTRMRGAPRPVPPVFQPEVIARAALHVARHPTRELWVGASTVKAIIGQKLVPAFADWYLARTGYRSQQVRDRPVPPGRPDNLVAPLAGDRGAHGPFDREARGRSGELWLRLHRGRLLAAAAAVAAMAAAGLRAARA